MEKEVRKNVRELKSEFSKFKKLQEIEEPSDDEKDDLETAGNIIQFLTKRILKLLDLEELSPYVSVTPKFTLETLRGHIDRLGVSSIMKDDNIVIILSADDDFPFDVVMHYKIEREWLKCVAYPVGCDIKSSSRDEAMNIINEYNKATRMFKAYIDDEGTIWLERQEFLDACLRYHTMYEALGAEMTLAWNFYKDNKDFFLANKND